MSVPTQAQEAAQGPAQAPEPERPVCPSCEWLNALQTRAENDPEGTDESALADVRVLRRRHAAARECLNPEEAPECP